MASVILFVDDEPVSPALESELERRGYGLVQAPGDPEEVLGLVASGEPVLVFLEPLLAGCDGFGLMEAIAAAQPELPIVVVTRGQHRSVYPRAAEIGCRDFLTKPVLPSQILACVFDLAGQPPERPVDTRQDAAPASAAEPELAGGAQGLSFAELFQELHEAGFSGVVIASHAGRRTGVELRNGTPVAASSNAGRERLEDFLLRRGRITQAQHDALIDQLAAGLGRAEEILVGMEAVSEDDLRAARADQGRDILLETFAWPQSSHRLLPGKRLKADTALAVESSAAAVLLEGVLEHAAADHVAAWLDRSRDLYVSEGARWERDEVPLSQQQQALAKSLQGERSVVELVAAGEAPGRVLCALTLAGALELHADPVLMLQDTLELVKPAEPEPEPEREAAPVAPAAPARRAERRRKPRAVAPPEPQPEPEPAPEVVRPAPVLRERVRTTDAGVRVGELERRVAELTALAEQLSERDDFGVLEVSTESSDEEVHAAYRAKLAFEPLNPPAELARDPALAEQVRRIRDRFALAYKHLRTQDGRRVHAALRKGPRTEPADAERALDAEGWFRKGAAFLESGDHGKALEALGMAAHLDPQQGEYSCHLGYALYLSNPRNDLVRREAMEHMAKGIKLSPDRPLSYVFLGRALKASDDLPNAKRMFLRALKIDREFHPALQELRLLASRREKEQKAGLLGRLRRS